MPALVQLAVAAHANTPDAREIAEEAVDITMEELPGRLAAEQLDVILGMVDSALRAQLERRVTPEEPPRLPRQIGRDLPA